MESPMGKVLPRMTPQEYTDAALRMERTPDYIAGPGGHQLARIDHASKGLVTEAGELTDALKRVLIYGKPLDRTNVLEEIGDILWYAALGLDAIGASFEDAFESNIAKLRVRYPDQFDPARALTRDVEAERAALERPR